MVLRCERRGHCAFPIHHRPSREPGNADAVAAMRVLLYCFGTEGDIRPFVALARGLGQRGRGPRCAPARATATSSTAPARVPVRDQRVAPASPRRNAGDPRGSGRGAAALRHDRRHARAPCRTSGRPPRRCGPISSLPPQALGAPLAEKLAGARGGRRWRCPSSPRPGSFPSRYSTLAVARLVPTA